MICCWIQIWRKSRLTTVLMSSHREYRTEQDWEWLRNDSGYSDALVFEPQERDGKLDDDVCEMIVTDRWMSKVSC